MFSPSRQIPLDAATAGMVLSDNLLDSSGRVLLTQGATLTEATLASLRRHQIETISVACDAAPEIDAEAALAQRLERVDRLFRKPASDSEDANGILLQYVRQYRQSAAS